MDSYHLCILRHEGNVMMFPRYTAARQRAFRGLLQPLGIQTVGGCPIFFDTHHTRAVIMPLGPWVTLSHWHGNWLLCSSGENLEI
jgi:hypothetical protein